MRRATFLYYREILMITDPVRACEALLNQTIEGIRVDDIEQTVTITCSRGVIIFDIEASEVTIQVEDKQ